MYMASNRLRQNHDCTHDLTSQISSGDWQVDSFTLIISKSMTSKTKFWSMADMRRGSTKCGHREMEWVFRAVAIHCTKIHTIPRDLWTITHTYDNISTISNSTMHFMAKSERYRSKIPPLQNIRRDTQRIDNDSDIGISKKHHKPKW
jgi:hypothetical protein